MRRAVFVLSMVVSMALAAGGLSGAAATDDPSAAAPETAVASTTSMVSVADGPDSITICSFDTTRSNRAFSTSDSYGVLRAALLDSANFGPGGVDERPVNIRPGVPAITAANIDGCDVFLAQEVFVDLSTDEGTALRDAYGTGRLLVVIESDSNTGTINGANSVITALGRPAGVGAGGTGGANDPNGGTFPLDAPDRAANGPFGDLRGGTFATSTSASVLKFGQLTVESAGTKVRKSRGRILIGGDPSGLNLFTRPGEFFYNPNNATMYLNFISTAL